jgi:hypothetical protein
VTEGNGHVIDPNGDARRALLQAVADHGPEVLSDTAIMDTVCRDHLTGLPGESILIGNAARTNVPARLSELIPQLGNYGAIQSAAASLAGEHNLDMAASLWVVREYARALGYIAPGTATGTSASFPGSGPRPVPGSGPRPVPGSGPRPVPGSGPGPVPGPGSVTGADSAGSPARIPVIPSPAGATGAGGRSGAAEAGREEAGGAGQGGTGQGGTGQGGAEAGGAVPEGAAAGAAAGAVAGAVAGEAFRGENAGSKAGPSGAAAAEKADGRADAGPGGPGGADQGGHVGGAAGAGEVMAAGPEGSYTGPASGGTAQGSGTPAATGPIGGSPVSTGPMGSTPATGGSQGRPWSEAPPAGAAAGGGTAGGGTAGGRTAGGVPGGGFPEREPGFPLPLPAGRLPGRQAGPPRAKVINRNTVGIAAAIALVAGYLGVAAVAHLSPFPAKTPPPAVSSSQSSSPPASTSSSPASSPDPSADPTPTSPFDILMTKIPAAVRNQDNQSSCQNAGTQFGATAVSQCQRLQGLAANIIIYYLYPDRAALASGFNAFLKKQKFSKVRECTTNGSFSDFVVECQSDFTIKTPGATGSIAEYTSTTQDPIIVSTDNEQNVMAVMIGTNDGDLLTYWNKLNWVVSS